MHPGRRGHAVLCMASPAVRLLEHGIGHRADVRVDALEVAQHVEMGRRRLHRLRPALAQPLEMALGCRQLGGAQLHLVRDQLARLADVAGHEHGDCDREAIENAFVERLDERHAESFMLAG